MGGGWVQGDPVLLPSLSLPSLLFPSTIFALSISSPFPPCSFHLCPLPPCSFRMKRWGLGRDVYDVFIPLERREATNCRYALQVAILFATEGDKSPAASSWNQTRRHHQLPTTDSSSSSRCLCFSLFFIALLDPGPVVLKLNLYRRFFVGLGPRAKSVSRPPGRPALIVSETLISSSTLS